MYKKEKTDVVQKKGEREKDKVLFLNFTER